MRKICAAVILSVLIFILGEIICRLYYGFAYTSRLFQMSPVKGAIYEFKPNTTEIRWKTAIKINSLGFRDNEYSRTKPKNTTRIFILGDSIVMGSNVSLEDSFAKRLEVLLGKQYEVWNLGVSAYDSWKEAAILKEKWINYDPDIIILAICLNDFDNSKQLYWVDPFGRFKYRDNSRARYFNWLYYHSDFYRFLYDRLYIIKSKLKNRAAQPGGLNLTKEQKERWEIPLRSIVDTSKNKKLIFVIFPLQHQAGKIKESDPFLNEFCKKFNVRHLDLVNILKSEYFYDLLHLNKVGHEITAETIYRFLKKEGFIDAK